MAFFVCLRTASCQKAFFLVGCENNKKVRRSSRLYSELVEESTELRDKGLGRAEFPEDVTFLLLGIYFFN